MAKKKTSTFDVGSGLFNDTNVLNDINALNDTNVINNTKTSNATKVPIQNATNASNDIIVTDNLNNVIVPDSNIIITDNTKLPNVTNATNDINALKEGAESICANMLADQNIALTIYSRKKGKTKKEIINEAIPYIKPCEHPEEIIGKTKGKNKIKFRVLLTKENKEKFDEISRVSTLSNVETLYYIVDTILNM